MYTAYLEEEFVDLRNEALNRLFILTWTRRLFLSTASMETQVPVLLVQTL